MKNAWLSRRSFLRLAAMSASAALVGCTKTVTVEVEKIIQQTVEVEKVVKEEDFKDVVLGRCGWMEAELPIDMQVAKYNLLPEREEDRVRISLDPSVKAASDPVLAEMMAAGDYIPWNTVNCATPWLEIENIVDLGTAQPWDPYFDTSRYQEQKNRLLGPDMIESVRLDSSYQGKLWMFPLQIDMISLSYRSDWFAEVGMDGQPQTMDELYDVCKAVHDKHAAEGVYGFYPNVHSTYGYMSALHQAYSPGDLAYDSDGLINVLDEGWLEAMAWTKRVVDAGMVPPGWETTGAYVMADAGLLGAALLGTGAAARAGRLVGFQRQKMGTIPVGNSSRVKESGTMFWATGVPLFKAGPHPQEAVDFFLWAMDPSDSAMPSGMWTTGKMAPWYSYYGEEFINPTDISRNWALSCLPTLTAAAPASKNKWFMTLARKIENEMVAYLHGQKSAEVAMTDALRDAKEEIAKGSS